MTNPLFDNFKEMLEDEDDYDYLRAMEEISSIMETEETEYSVVLLSALFEWMKDHFEDEETVRIIVKELL